MSEPLGTHTTFERKKLSKRSCGSLALKLLVLRLKGKYVCINKNFDNRIQILRVDDLWIVELEILKRNLNESR
jgi:hypothetical protein